MNSKEKLQSLKDAIKTDQKTVELSVRNYLYLIDMIESRENDFQIAFNDLLEKDKEIRKLNKRCVSLGIRLDRVRKQFADAQEIINSAIPENTELTACKRKLEVIKAYLNNNEFMALYEAIPDLLEILE